MISVDSRVDMKTGLSYHDAAAQNGEMPPTMWWDHILISLSIFDAVPRHLGDKFVIINSTFKAVESSYPIFHFKPLFVVPLPQRLSFRSNVDALSPRFITEEVVCTIDGSCIILSRWLVQLDCFAFLSISRKYPSLVKNLINRLHNCHFCLNGNNLVALHVFNCV